MKILRLRAAPSAQDDMPLVLRLTAPQTAIYRSWNDTGHGSCVSIFGPGGAKVTAVAHRQTAIYRAVYKINPCCRSLDQTARILCIDMRVSLQPLFLWLRRTYLIQCNAVWRCVAFLRKKHFVLHPLNHKHIFF